MNSRKVRCWILVFLGIGWAMEAIEGEYRYREVRDRKETIHTFQVERQGEGWRISLDSRGEQEVIRQVFQLEKNWDTRFWEFIHDLQNTRIKARRRGGIITLEGIHRGDRIQKNFSIGDDFWNQLFHIGLRPFILSGDRSITFQAIGTSGIGEMKIARFRAVRKGIETIRREGRVVPAVYVTLSLAGFRSVFWTGHYWFEKNGGLFIRYLNEPGSDPAKRSILLEGETVAQDNNGPAN